MTNHLKCLIAILVMLTEGCDLITCDSDLPPLKNIEFYKYSDSEISAFPKCCPMKTSLVVTDDGINCTSSERTLHHYEIFTTNIATLQTSFFSMCQGIECVDFLKKNTNWELARMLNCEIKTIYKQYTDFPKCCPFDFAYDPQEHKCVQQKNPVFAFNESLQVINVSLSHCPRNHFAIVDFHDDEFHINTDKSITLESGREIKHGRYCIDKNVKTGKEMIRACIEYEDACNQMKKRCVKKCCPDGEVYILEKRVPMCTPYYGAVFNLIKTGRFNYSDADDAIIIPIKGTKYPAIGKHDFYVDSTGYMHIVEESDWIRLSPMDAFYCAEHYKNGEGGKTEDEKPLMFLFTRSSAQEQFKTIKFVLQSTIFVLSCILLLVTILCYMFLPEMQNVHGKSITAFCIFMFIGFLTLCVAQLHGRILPPPAICTTIGFMIVFAFLGAFAWMNVICFDMWMALGMMRVLNIQNKRKDLKKFLWYCLYGCGVPIIIGGCALIVRQTECLPDKFVPHIGRFKCYFEKHRNTYDHLLYFIIPQSTMIFINVIFFIKTAAYCYKVKNEIQRMRSSISNEQESKQQLLEDHKEKIGYCSDTIGILNTDIPNPFVPDSTLLAHHCILYLLLYYLNCMVSKSSGSQVDEQGQEALIISLSRFFMLVKLFFVMGIPWTFEALQSIFEMTNSWMFQMIVLIVDCFNASQGIIIFCIFILKKKVWKSIKMRLGMASTRRVSELSTGITNDITTSGSGKDNGLARNENFEGSHM